MAKSDLDIINIELVSCHSSSDQNAQTIPSSATTSNFLEAHTTLAHAKLAASRTGPLTLRHLFQPVVVRQYIHDGKLYKEAAYRRPSRFELFVDIAYGGVCHILAEEAAEASNGLALAKLVLTFFPTWSIRSDVQSFVNVHGSDDVKMRIYLLLMVLLLYGYTANAAAVEIEYDATIDSYSLVDGSLDAVKAAATFFLVAKGLRIFLHIYYACSLRRFTTPLLLGALATATSSSIYLALLFVKNQIALLILMCVALGLEAVTRGFGASLAKWLHARNSAKSYIPAINIEHLSERNVQLIIVVFGEALIKSSYITRAERIGANYEFGRSTLGIIISFTLMWLYFDADSSRTFAHALRRHWVSHICFRVFHFFLVLSILLYSAALSTAITKRDIKKDQHWILAGGVASALLCIAVLGVLHKSLDERNSGLLPRRFRLLLRFAVAIGLACSPLVITTTSSTILLLTLAGALFLLLVVETVTKLGTVRVNLDEAQADVNQPETPGSRNKLQKHWHRHKDDLMDVELGEEDVGIDDELCELEIRDVYKTQKIAYTA